MHTRKITLAVAAGVAAFAAVTASAATLGGISSDNLGADTGVVASCDSDGIDVSYTTALVAGAYALDTVELSGIANACAGQSYTIDVLSGNTSLGTVTGTVGATGSDSVDVSGEDLSAEQVDGLALVITG